MAFLPNALAIANLSPHDRLAISREWLDTVKTGFESIISCDIYENTSDYRLYKTGCSVVCDVVVLQVLFLSRFFFQQFSIHNS